MLFRQFFFLPFEFLKHRCFKNRAHKHTCTHIQKISRLTITGANTDLQINVLSMNNCVIYFVHCLNEFKTYPTTRNKGNISDWKYCTNYNFATQHTCVTQPNFFVAFHI